MIPKLEARTIVDLTHLGSDKLYDGFDFLERAAKVAIEAVADGGIGEVDRYCHGLVVHALGYEKPEGELPPHTLPSGFSVDEQLAVAASATSELVEGVKAKKPAGQALLLWRRYPNIVRSITTDGLRIYATARFKWMPHDPQT